MIEYCPEMQEIHRLWKILKHQAYFGPKTPLIYLYSSIKENRLPVLTVAVQRWMDVCIEFQTEENGEHLSLEFNEI